MPKIYCISGLGADENAFSNLGQLSFETIKIKWIKAEKDEPLAKYAHRLVKKDSIKPDDILIGLSFGGLICQHIAHELKSERIILISSFRDSKDLRGLFRWGLKFKWYKLMPNMRVGWLDELIANYLNSGTTLSKPVIRKMLDSTDFKFMKWAIKQIDLVQKKNLGETELLSLLGTNDRIVKQWNASYSEAIAGGSHFMIFDNAKEITRRINQFIIPNDQKD